jgi:hypothetical protein
MDISYATPTTLDSPQHVVIAEELAYKRAWADQLARVRELAFTSLFVAVPSDEPAATVRRLGEEVRPRLFELVS